MSEQPPIALTIAGSDCCAGAGLQADLKTFGSLGVHGLTVVTAVVAETPLEVAEVHELPPAVVQSQLSLLLRNYPVAAVKTGMLYSAAHVVAVADLLAGTGLPLVVDPVMIASSGASLLDPEAVETIVERLLPLATLVTPNHPEALVLLGDTADASPADAARRLGERLGGAVLLTGGHNREEGEATDILWHDGTSHEFTAPWVDLPSSHGTGCTISAAITAGLAKGLAIPEAVGQAKDFVSGALRGAHRWPGPGERELVALNQGR